eukprot:4765307-Heterocapsa_arctica.AAC.1
MSTTSRRRRTRRHVRGHEVDAVGHGAEEIGGGGARHAGAGADTGARARPGEACPAGARARWSGTPAWPRGGAEDRL